MKRIFLVEDDREIAKNLTRLLRTEDFTVIHALSQAEAFARLDKERFDLALIDLSLPDGNGFTVCTEIKATQGAPVIFLTASGDEASVVTGLKMESVGDPGRIEIACTDTLLYTEIVVRDYGTGFAKEDLQNLFERFYRGKSSVAAGYGIGLALCKRIIVRQGGTVSAKNHPQGGAVFTIRFPK